MKLNIEEGENLIRITPSYFFFFNHKSSIDAGSNFAAIFQENLQNPLVITELNAAPEKQ